MEGDMVLQDSGESDEEETSDNKEFINLLTQLKNRCDGTRIKYEEVNEEINGENIFGALLTFPSGRETRTFRLNDALNVKKLLAVDFAEYSYLKGYEAICSYSKGCIEALIRSTTAPSRSMLQRIFRGVNGQGSSSDVQSDEPKIILFRSESSEENVERITIGTASDVFRVLVRGIGIGLNGPLLTIRFDSIKISQHDKAIEYLERLANSLLFQIDVQLDISFSLVRERAYRNRFSPRGEDQKINIHFPKFIYDKEPMSLYWYARSARGMPLLQYLAYYQVIEYYFPAYSRFEAMRRVRNIVKDESFNPHKDTDIARILNVVKMPSNRGFGDERSQLRATLQECVDPDDLRQFLISNEERRKFFQSKQKGLTDKQINLTNSESDLRHDIADRVYDIRCKIVHTKADENDEYTLLLPYSKEAELLFHDIDLLQYIARRVLFASSSKLGDLA